MKTEVAKINGGNKSSVKSMEDRVIVQGARRSLHPLQKAAGDKENLVGAGRLGMDTAGNKEKSLATSSVKNSETAVKKLKTSRNAFETRRVSADDLTNEESPSSSYWQILCERQRAALDAALSENKQLHDRVKVLEEENEQCKILLDETKALVETLKEMLNDDDDQTSGEE